MMIPKKLKIRMGTHPPHVSLSSLNDSLVESHGLEDQSTPPA